VPCRCSDVTLSKAVVFARNPSGAPPIPALAEVANRPLICHALDWLDGCGLREVAIVAGDGLSPELRAAVGDPRAWRFETRWLDQMPGERFVESLSALGDFLAGEPFVLHLADTLSKQDLAGMLDGTPVARDEALLLVPELVLGDGGSVIPLHARRDGGTTTAAGGELPAGVAVIGAAAGDAAGALDVFPQGGIEVVANRLRELGGTVRGHAADGWWRFRRGADALLEGNRFALEGIGPDYGEATLERADIQGAVVVHPSAHIESSVVRGPVVIGPGARLRDAYVGPYTSIGRDVLIEGAELEHSIILPEASICHLGGRLEASIVGPRAQVFRDFRLPRALRLNLGAGAEVSLA
jgi:glucose-1-phosphate thymidylyltransferase